MLTTILIFIVLLGLLVFVHELGHFLVAKKAGMVVHEFGFGFPPRLFGLQKHNGSWRVIWGNKEVNSEQTVYSVNAILLGGFVRIMGEDATEATDSRSFVNRPFWPRFLTLVAGVTMNFLLAAVLLGIGFTVGLPTVINSPADVPSGARFVGYDVTVLQVAPDSPAAKAGLQVGDKIIGLDTTRITDVSTAQQILKAKPRQIVAVSTMNPKGETTTQEVTLAVDETGNGKLGVGLGIQGTLTYPWYSAFGQGFISAGRGIGQIVVGLGSLFVSKEALSGVGGPVKIAQ
jgi:regulator of sigma E protease